MTVRDEIKGLLRDLSSDDEETLLWAIHNAGLLLEKSHLHRCAERVASEDYWKSLPQEAQELRHLIGTVTDEKIHEQFRGLLPGEYRYLVLTEEEADTITNALIGLLEGPPKIAGAAASAFVRTDRLSAVPTLTEMLRRYAATDGGAAHQAIVAIETIITRSVDPRRPLTLDQEGVIAEAFAALRFAGATAVEHALEPREAAASALLHLSQYLGRSF